MPKNDADELQTTLAKLVVAHHILHQQGVLSSSSAGGVYVRNPLNHNVFFSSDMVGTAPGLIEGRGDLRGWNVGDGTPLTHPLANIPTTPAAHITVTSEHHIAASLLHKYPSLNSIIHISPSLLLSFAAPGSPSLRAMYNRAAFLGLSVPVFDIGKRYPKASTAGSVAGYLGGLVSRGGAGAGDGVVEKGHAHDMCVNTKGLGDALAEAFVMPASAGASALEMARSLSLTSTPGKEASERQLPDFAVMLLRGNGAVVVASSIEDAVYRAILTVENAMMQKDAMIMHAAMSSRSTDFSLVSKGGGTGQHGEGRGEKMEIVAGIGREWDGGLAADELRDAVAGNKGEVVGKAWRGWVGEVRRSGAYVNEMDELVGGRR